MKLITKRLDKIATDLENKGYIKEATEIDIISNTIDSLPNYSVGLDPLYKSFSLSLHALAKGRVDSAYGFLNAMKDSVERRLENYGHLPAVKTYCALYKAIMENLEKRDYSLENAVSFIKDAQEYMIKAEEEMNSSVMSRK